MGSVKTRKLVTTAIIVALAMVFQMLLMLGLSWKAYLVGSLVNLCIIVAATVVDTWSGVAVSILTPFIAMLYAHQPLPMIPFIIAGNIVLSLAYSLFALKNPADVKIEWPRWAIVGVIAALLKYVVIAGGNAIITGAPKGLGFVMTATVVQPITAIIAMILGAIVIAALPKQVKSMRVAKD